MPTSTTVPGGVVPVHEAARRLGPSGPSARTLKRMYDPDKDVADATIVKFGECYYVKQEFLRDCSTYRRNPLHLLRLLPLLGIPVQIYMDGKWHRRSPR